MKIKVQSKFHGREAVVIVKDRYKDKSIDVLGRLDYEVYNDGKDTLYAKRKLAEIKRKVCGSSGCQCMIEAEEINP